MCFKHSNNNIIIFLSIDGELTLRSTAILSQRRVSSEATLSMVSSLTWHGTISRSPLPHLTMVTVMVMDMGLMETTDTVTALLTVMMLTERRKLIIIEKVTISFREEAFWGHLTLSLFKIINSTFFHILPFMIIYALSLSY